MLEVSHFTPSDLTVKLVDDTTVVVEGKHGERKDQEGFVSREFTRKYLLPESVKPSTIECFLSSDGVLVIRGHAATDQQRNKSPFRDMMTTNDSDVIPLYTQGYNRYDIARSVSPGGERIAAVQERVIPITKEDKPASASTNTANNVERLRSSSHEDSSKVRQNKERTVSFTEEENSVADDLFSKSFSAATKSTSTATTTAASTRPLSGGVSWTIPVNGSGTMEDPIIISPDPVYKRNGNGGVSMTIPVSTSEAAAEHTGEGDPYIVTSGRSSRASRSPLSTPMFNESGNYYANGHHHQEPPVASTSKGPSSNADKTESSWRNKSHKHEDFTDSRRDRHFSSESRNEFMPSLRDRHFSSESRDRLFGRMKSHRFDSDLFSSAKKLEQEIEERFGRPLIHRDRDLFSSDIGLFPSITPLHKEFPDFKDIPLKSNEESYEKNFEKGYNKDGHWEENFQEKFHSQKYASWSSSSNDRTNGNQETRRLMETNQPHNEHRINISSPA